MAFEKKNARNRSYLRHLSWKFLNHFCSIFLKILKPSNAPVFFLPATILDARHILSAKVALFLTYFEFSLGMKVFAKGFFGLIFKKVS